MAGPDDDRPIRKPAYEIGDDLSASSVGELNERIGVLKAEIERIEEAIRQKRESASVAESFFKR